MESQQFETLMLAITGLRNEMKSEISGLRGEMKSEFRRIETKMDTGFAEIRNEMNTGFVDVRKDLKSIREQVAITHVDVTELKSRVSTIEGPRA